MRDFHTILKPHIRNTEPNYVCFMCPFKLRDEVSQTTHGSRTSTCRLSALPQCLRTEPSGKARYRQVLYCPGSRYAMMTKCFNYRTVLNKSTYAYLTLFSNPICINKAAVNCKNFVIRVARSLRGATVRFEISEPCR